MKSKVSMVLIALMMLGATGFAFADGAFGPAAIYANLTGTTVEEAYAEKVEADSTFGELAKDAGVYEEFQAEALEAKTELVKKSVSEGTLSQEEGDAIIAALESCDGEQTHIMQGTMGFGQKAQNGEGNGTRVMSGSGNQNNRGENGMGYGMTARAGE
jgi:hypothetical protein